MKACLIVKWGFQNSKADTSLFLKETQSSLILVLIYADDILITGYDSRQLKKFIEEFSRVYALKDLGTLSYFLGIELAYAADGIYLSQKKYITDLLIKAYMLNCKGCGTPMATGAKLQKQAQGHLGQYIEDVTGHRSLVGGLQYLILTRLEISFAVHKLSQYVATPTL